MKPPPNGFRALPEGVAAHRGDYWLNPTQPNGGTWVETGMAHWETACKAPHNIIARSIFHRRHPFDPASVALPFLSRQGRMTLNILAWVAAVQFLCGCAVVHIDYPDGGPAFKASIPAWPWQDSARVLERMNLSARTNGAFTASIRGLTESETTSTNFPSIIEAVVAGAVKGAVGAIPK